LGHSEDNRLFVDAVLWLVRAGAPGRGLREEFGKGNCVLRRFRRWAKGRLGALSPNSVAYDRVGQGQKLGVSPPPCPWPQNIQISSPQYPDFEEARLR
jgi:hypothetical protein